MLCFDCSRGMIYCGECDVDEWGGERVMKIFKITYQIPPLRAIYSHGVGAEDEETAIKRFKANNPKAKIMSVENMTDF